MTLAFGGLAAARHDVLSSFEKDGAGFLFDATYLLEGRGYDSDFWPFGYPVVVALFSMIPGLGLFTAAKAVSVVSGGAFVAGSWVVARRAGLEPVDALVAAGLVATSPTFTAHLFLVETDMLFAALFLVPVAVLLGESSSRQFLVAGAATGLAGMVKFGVYALIPVAAVLAVRRIDRKSLVGGLKYAALFLLAYLAASSPWLAYNAWVNGSPFYSLHHVNIAWGMHRPDPLPPEYWSAYFDLAPRYRSSLDVVSNFVPFASNWVRNLVGVPRNLLRVMPIVGMMILPGILVALRKPKRRDMVLLLIVGSFTMLVTVAYAWDRYFLPIVPVLAIFVVRGLRELVPGRFELSALFEGSRMAVPLRGPVIMLLLVGSAWMSIEGVQGLLRHSHQPQYRIAGEWLRERVAEGEWIMVPQPHVAWYAGTDRYVNYPRDGSLPLEEAVREREQTTFFFIQEGLSSKVVEPIAWFVWEPGYWNNRAGVTATDGPPEIPGNFTEVFRLKDAPGPLMIYRVDRSRPPRGE